MAGGVSKSLNLPGSIDHIVQVFQRGRRVFESQMEGIDNHDYSQAWVTAVNIYTQTVCLQLTGSMLTLDNVPYIVEGGNAGGWGRHPHRGDLAFLVQLPTANPVKSWMVVRFTTSYDLQGHAGELMPTDTPKVFNYPFHPLGMAGESFEVSPWMGRRLTSVILEDTVRDGQQRVLDPIAHQAVDNLVHHKRWAAGVLSLVGPMQRNQTQSMQRLADDSVVEYLTKGFVGSGVDDSNSWLKMAFTDAVEMKSPIVEDAHVLYEYSDLLPMGGFDRGEAQTTAPYGQKPLMYYGHGTFVTPVTTGRAGDPPLTLKFGKIQVPKVFDDDDARVKNLKWEDKTSQGKPAPNTASTTYDPLVSWTILPSGSDVAQDVVVGLHRSGRLTVVLGRDGQDKQSLNMHMAGRAKVVIGKDDQDNSLLLDLEGKARVRTGTAENGVTALLETGKIDLTVKKTGAVKSHLVMDDTKVDINDGNFVVDVGA